ncbi:MAG: helix-turn-helix transcriptional regulator [Bacteriovoracaceae bacterium]|nr:helix-turn-helix transcriptional regulator [Bacteriovoracaceae bacterium]
MGKRTKIINVTKESQALKQMRMMKGLSVRKVAELLNVSHTLVSHLELGRANISEAYLDKFLDVLDLSWEDWNITIGSGKKAQTQAKTKITEDCLKKLKDFQKINSCS